MRNNALIFSHGVKIIIYDPRLTINKTRFNTRTEYEPIVAISLANSRAIKDWTLPTLPSHYDIDMSRVLEHSGSRS